MDKSDAFHRSAASQAQAMSLKLRSLPPAVNYKGFVPLTRGVCGETFTRQCLSARATCSLPGKDSMTSEAWTRPHSVSAASRIVCRGKGPRVDLQDQHTPEECSTSLATLMSARARGQFMMTNPGLRRTGEIKDADRFLSYDPCPSDRGGRLKPGRIDASQMQAAGASSICRKFDDLRHENYRRELFAAIRDNEIVSAIRR
eukprot:gb/GFBE01062765.1/.p1 GENE.gb/GFBE01062765.1/~~gb/GFBE01062765.1/.p1  ORF type:complete len:201 (+),score=23.64 gb/GFBE01062765.1/:1-603(+)